MQCREFEDRLNDVLDGRGDPAADRRLSAHADECEPCRQRLAGQRLLLAGLRRYAPPSLPAGFAHGVVRAAVAVTPARSQQSSRLWLAAGTLLASAASALLAFSLLWYARSREPIVADLPTPPAVKRENKSPPRARLGTGRGGTLAISQADLLLEAPHLGDHLLDGLDGFAEAFPETALRYGEVERLAPGIRPLRLSFALLWDTLFRSLPGVRDRSRPAPSPGGTSSLVIDLVRLA